MNETHLRETLEQVINLVPRYSWEIMDEEQKDALMAKIVLPRYMATTSDGTNLGPTTWAAILGTTGEAIRGRVNRLRRSEGQDGAEAVASESRKTDIRAARRVLADPVSRAALVESMPVEAKVDVAKSLAKTPASTPVSPARARQSQAAMAPLKRTMNDLVVGLGTVTLIDRATAEINDAVSNDGLGPDAIRQIEEAIERLNGALDFAKSMAGEAAA